MHVETISADTIYAALQDILSHQDGTPQSRWLQPYDSSDVTLANQAIVFLKPEATDLRENVRSRDIIQMALDAFEKWRFHVGAVRIINAEYLEHFQIMDKHYGVINQISRIGEDALSPSIKQKLHETFAEELAHGAEILGGHQMLQRFPQLSPFALMILNDNLGRQKIASGTYATTPITVQGKRYIMLNTFHAYQLEHFIRSGRALVLFDLHFETNWKEWHYDFLGATNPPDAADGSMRHEFLLHASRLGLAEVNILKNVAHGSAGPLEAMAEVQRFFSDNAQNVALSYADTSFGKLLLQSGLTMDEVQLLAANPLLEVDGTTLSAFDMTEDNDSYIAAEKLVAVLKK